MSLTRRAIAGALGAIVTILLAVAVGVPLACHRVPPWSFAGFSMTVVLDAEVHDAKAVVRRSG